MNDLIRDRQTGPARIRLKDYLDTHPNDAQATFLFGLSYWREQKYSQATPYFEIALRYSPEFYLPNHFLGWSLYYLGDLARARKAFEAFLDKQPDEPDSQFGLGLIELDEDNLDQAEARFRRSIEILQSNPKTQDAKALAKAHMQLGEILSRRSDLENAHRELKLSTDLYPDGYEAYYKLYRVLVRLGKTSDADRALQKFKATKQRVRPETQPTE